MTYRLLNPTKLEIEWVIKKNRTWLKPNLHAPYHLMLALCADDLLRSGAICRLEVIFQTGRSRSQQKYCGLFEYDPSIMRSDRIFIYTYRRRVDDILHTIAHEFGHAAHYRTIPSSKYWSDNQMEQYANLWAKAMIHRFHGNEFEVAKLIQDVRIFQQYMDESIHRRIKGGQA